MPNEYNGDRIVLRDTSGTQMSLPRFFQLALNDGNGHGTFPSQGTVSGFNPNHHAWDMATGGLTGIVPARTPVCGTVTSAAQSGWNEGMGTYAIVMDDLGRLHRFFHFAEGSLRVSVGDTVNQGDMLAMIGSTGDSTGAHLHYDVVSNGSKLSDPIDAFDCTTLPAGWNINDAASAQNWDYIQLDDAATDYGPPGGETPADPFFTDKYIYDISGWQSDVEVRALCDDPTTGGFIIRFAWNGSQDAKVASFYAMAKDAGIPVGFYSASDKNITHDGAVAYRAMLQEQLTALYDSLGVRPKDCPIGIWLDLESWGEASGTAGCGWAATPAENLQQIQMFREVFTPKGYVVLGWYTNLAGIRENILDGTDTSWKDYPFWYSRPGVSRALVNAELSQFGISNCYVWQDGYDPYWSPDKQYVHTNVDNDTILQPIPVAGGGGGGSYTEVINIKVDLVPPKRIYFSPVPGTVLTDSDLLSERTCTIDLRTDADNAVLWYTTDGSSPYQYTYDGTNLVYAVAANAIQYVSSITINKDTHIRVVAAPSGILPGEPFPELLAKGSGTYLFAYQGVVENWEEEQKSYATSDENIAFFEDNLQAFLLEHTMQTPEEVLYADVYRHDVQSTAEDAQDNASTTSEAEPTIRPMG